MAEIVDTTVNQSPCHKELVDRRNKSIGNYKTDWASLVWKSEIKLVQNLKPFECQYDTISGKFHSWPHVIGHGQNISALKILYKITFWLYAKMYMKQK
jgi:hypothetical protein